MVDTTAQHIAARNDKDLLDRLVAVAEQAQIPNAAEFVQTQMGRLVSTPIDGDSTITTVHAYASQVREEAVKQLPLPAGLNPAAVTDQQLSTAIQAVWEPSN